MPPNLADYQAVANSIYEPQKAAEATALGVTRDTTKNALESQKGQVNTDYQDAINQLTHSVQDQSSQINQLYTERLGGNFSGLQGNDLGNMFARANEQQATISSTRANKLGEITAGQTNADIAYGAGIASLTPKYQSLESDYAQSGYGSAVKDYKDQQYKQQQLSLSAAKLASSNASKTASQFKVTGKANTDGTTGNSNANGYSFTGPNNKPVSLAEYVAGSGGDINDVLDLLQNGSSYDRNIYKNLAGLQDPQQILSVIKSFDKNNYYGFK